VPIEITDAMFTSSSIAEPDAGETAWVSAAAYVLEDRRYRATTHKIYECVQAHTGRTALPEDDSAYWLEYRPTNKWAAVDNQISTQSVRAASLTMTFEPGFFNALALYGMEGDSVDVTVKEAAGGALMRPTDTVSLVEDSPDWYEWLFSPVRQKTKVLLTEYPPSPTAEITIAITGATAKCGMVVIGDYRPLSSFDGFGTRTGAKAEPVDFSWIKTLEDGTTKIMRRNSATDMRAEIILKKEDADPALLSLQYVLAVPAAFVATEEEGNAGLNVFGLGTGSVTYDKAHATIGLYVKGLI
jgi:hypothetical protein